MEEYIIWESETPGISFCEKYGRITVFKKTLEALGYPACFRFLFDPTNNGFAVQSCEMDAEGAHRLPSLIDIEGMDIKSKALVRFVYRSCQWNRKISYRVPGRLVVSHNMICFDLNDALEIHEGRLLTEQQEPVGV